jgi:carboxylesterase
MAKQPRGVLIVHGFSASLDCVREIQPPVQALGLPTRMPVLRGHGAASPDALRGVTWPEWMADAEAALEDLLTEADKAIVVGHSMGGLVALTLAADRPDVVDSLALAAAMVQLASPIGPGRPLNFLAPLLTRMLDKWDMPPVYAVPDLAQHDTNYPWVPTDAIASLFEFTKLTRQRLPEVRAPALIMQSRKDTTVAPRSAEIIYDEIGTPADQKRIVWFEVTEHEMFRDCEMEAIVGTVMEYVQERMGLLESPMAAMSDSSGER